MIHLAGRTSSEKIERARRELAIFERHGVNGAIVEDYHTNNVLDVMSALEELAKKKKTITLGVNLLQDPQVSFSLADEFGAAFVQLDTVLGPEDIYIEERNVYPDIAVLGGVRFKYTSSTGNSLEQDLEVGKSRCDAIVTTGSGTGIETPIAKLREFRQQLSDFPLIVGSGVNKDNAYEQLSLAGGAIVGNYLKGGDTTREVSENRVRNLMKVVRQVREK